MAALQPPIHGLWTASRAAATAAAAAPALTTAAAIPSKTAFGAWQD